MKKIALVAAMISLAACGAKQEEAPVTDSAAPAAAPAPMDSAAPAAPADSAAAPAMTDSAAPAADTTKK